MLELVVLEGVDERIDAAVAEYQYHSEVVEPENTLQTSGKIGTVTSGNVFT